MAAAARGERAADKIGGVADDGATKTVAAVRHRRKRGPAADFWIIALVFGERVVGRQLAAEHQDEAAVVRAGKAAARRWQRRRRSPGVGPGIVHVVQTGAV